MPGDQERSGPIRHYTDLLVYQKSYALSLEVHKLTLAFPDFERFEIGRQLRNASKSIAVNIAEGYGRKSSAADFKRFLVIALASCDEVKVWLSYAGDLGYLTGDDVVRLTSRYEEVGKMLHGLHRGWK
jgi:four helix bundle protein